MNMGRRFTLSFLRTGV